MLVSELLVFVQVLFSSSFFDFNWMQLGLTSLFVQWVVLSSAALLCNARPWLMQMSVPRATTVAFAIILLLTTVFSLLAEFILSGFIGMNEGGVGRVLRNFLIAMIMTTIAFRYFFLSHQLRVGEQAELSSRIQALQSRIRPHFLFNSMNIIASLITVDPEVAEEVVEDLSVLFRASLNDSTSEPVRLSEELDLCEKYVHIESLRLDDRLAMEWQIDVDPEKVRIPLLTLQPLLENAIYHGIQPRPDGGTVKVTIQAVEDRINIEITNPLSVEESSHERGNRMALDNIRNRLQAIYGAESSLIAERGVDEFVTRVSYPIDL